jgi:hypothetical protein
MLISYYKQEVGVHILERPCGQSWVVTRPCAIEIIERNLSFPLGMRVRAGYEGATVCRNNVSWIKKCCAVTEHRCNTEGRYMQVMQTFARI